MLYIYNSTVLLIQLKVSNGMGGAVLRPFQPGAMKDGHDS